MILPLEFYQRKTTTVAKELLGKKLVRILNGQRLSGVITEVEAYLGVQDKACHTYGNRRTARTEAMYSEGGHAYIYYIYGMHNCFNVVSEKENVPEAVLVRALEPMEGIETMKTLRKRSSLRDLCTGPAKLAQALQITRELNRLPLDRAPLFIENAPTLKPNQILARPRIGVAYAEEHATLPLRYYIKGCEHVSKK